MNDHNTDATTASTKPAGISDDITLQQPITRGNTKIEKIFLRKPKSGALRGINLAELLQLRAEAVMTLLPRISEPPLVAHEVAAMDPVDLIACATEIVNFLVPQQLVDQVKQDQLLTIAP